MLNVFTMPNVKQNIKLFSIEVKVKIINLNKIIHYFEKV